MGIVVFNGPGIVIAALAFGTAFVVGALAGTEAEGPLTLIGGNFVLILDVAYRLRRTDRNWFAANEGGRLLFLPAWQLGVFWIMIGIFYTWSS